MEEKRMIDQSQVTSGKVLLSEPFMADPNFKRAAVLLCEHGTEGSIGFIINRRLEMRVDDLVDEFPEFDAQVYFGGPVQTDTIHYLHNVGDLLDGSIPVTRGVYWGGNFEKLKFLISAELIKPHHIRFFIGYAGWSEGQLLDEMGFGSWVVANMDANYLFNSEPEDLWRKVMSNKGRNFSVLAELPDDITWN